MLLYLYNTSPKGSKEVKVGKNHKIRAIAVSKEVAFLEDQYNEALVALTTVTQVNWGASKRSPATIYKDGLRVAIEETKGLIALINQDLKNV